MDFDGFNRKCKNLADQLKAEKKLTVVGHYDADGLASTAILVKALRRVGVETDFTNTRQIDSDHISEVNSIDTPLVFVDMGSGQIELLEKEIKNKFYIVDHHPPVKETANQANPFHYRIDGTRELSAAGVAYFVAKAMDEKNMDMSPIGIVGAVGDMQDMHGGLVGANREIIKDAEKLGLIHAHKNLTLFGRQSRPLPKMLEYCSEPLLPGLTGNYIACTHFIEGLGIELKDPIGGEIRNYVDLSHEEKQKLTSALYMLLLDSHAPHLVLDMLIGEVYELPKEKVKTELRDAKEFATVLNACVAPETKIMNLDGSITNISEAPSLPTYSFNFVDGGITRNQYEKTHKIALPEGMHTFDITTRMGLNVVATENHPFLTAGSKGIRWKPAEELSADDYLALPRRIKTVCAHYAYEVSDLFCEDDILRKGSRFRVKKGINFIKNPRLAEDFFELVGFVIGDGHISKNAVNLVFGNNARSVELKLRYIRIIRRLFGLNNFTRDTKSTFENLIWSNTTLSRVFQKMGVPSGKKAAIVKISNKLLVAPDKYVAAVIRGLMESDGNVYHGGLEFSTHSKELAEQMPLILLRFGIKSHLGSRQCNDCEGKKYRVLICGYEDVLKYSKNIGFSTSERKAWLRKWLGTRQHGKSNTDLMPYAGDLLEILHAGVGIPNKWSAHFTYYKNGVMPKRENLLKYVSFFENRISECEAALKGEDIRKIINALNISRTRFSKSAGISCVWLSRILNGKTPGKNAIAKIQRGVEVERARIKECAKNLRSLKILVFSDLQWDRVKSVNPGGNCRYVYDLTMSGNHNYFANGILVHNCGRHEAGEVGVAVCMGDRDEAWSKAKSLLEKHRKELREGLEWIKGMGIEELDHIYWFDASGVIRDTLVGVIAGMVYGAMQVKLNKPIIAFGLTDEGEMKISGRGNYDLVRAGLKLGAALNEASRPLGGEGGGHDVAAGAKIPPEKKREFLDSMDRIVGRQLKK